MSDPATWSVENRTFLGLLVFIAVFIVAWAIVWAVMLAVDLGRSEEAGAAGKHAFFARRLLGRHHVAAQQQEAAAKAANLAAAVGSAGPAAVVGGGGAGDQTAGGAAAGEGQTKVTLFFAPWCGACKAFMPHWSEFKQKHGHKYDIVEVNGDEKQDEVQNQGIRGFPTVMVERDGSKKMKAGAVPLDSLLQFVESAGSS